MIRISALIILILISKYECAKILVINPTASHSHQIVIQPIVRELSKRGHSIVFATTHPIEQLRNVRQIDLSFTNEMLQAESNKSDTDFFKKTLTFFELMVEISEVQLNNSEIQQLIANETEHFDLVMAEMFIPTMIVFKEHFKCPLIGFVSMDPPNNVQIIAGNAYNPVLYPDSYLYANKNDYFLNRLYQFFMSMCLELHARLIVNRRVNKIIKTYFGEKYPDINTITSEMDMLFMSSNLVLHKVRPVTPATISIGGGIHMTDEKALPKALKDYLDQSTRGVIYISFGSNVKCAQFPPHLKNIFFKTLSELPYNVLWKFEDENLEDIPKNIKLMKWIPQQDVLRHKNVKLLITHGGLQSFEEALFSHVPMLVIPVFVDQPYNAHQIASKGMGLMIESLEVLTPDIFKSSVMELLTNTTYVKTLKKLANILRDQPMKPLERAVWWTEYVIRHKGAKHLKGPIAPIYHHYLLDIFVFLLFVMLAVLYIIYKLFRYVVLKICQLRAPKEKLL